MLTVAMVADVVCVCVFVCCACVRMEVGESETAQGRCEKTGTRIDGGQNMERGPGRK